MRLAEKPNDNDVTLKPTKKKDEEVYAGDEKRPFGRFEHSPQAEALIRDIRGVLCSTQNCIFSQEEQKTVKHLHGMYGDLGGDKPSQGIEKHRESTKFVQSVMLYLKDAKKYAWKLIVTGAVIFAGYALWYAFLREINKGG